MPLRRGARASKARQRSARRWPSAELVLAGTIEGIRQVAVPPTGNLRDDLPGDWGADLSECGPTRQHHLARGKLVEVSRNPALNDVCSISSSTTAP